MACYPVFLDGEAVGEAEVISEGLYYRFRCKCALPTKAVYRLTVAVSQKQYDLGICVPDGRTSIVNKRVAVKKFPKGEMLFWVSCNAEDLQGIQLTEMNPFPDIKSLLGARLQIKNGVHEIIIIKEDPATV